MKKTFLFVAFAAAMGITTVSAQTDSINAVARDADALATQKAQQAENWKDSVKDANVLTQHEHDVLQKDYNQVKKDYNTNRAMAEKQLKDGKEIDSAEALKYYKHDRKEFQKDSEALKRQHQKFNKATEDGVTEQERDAMRKQYKKDKKHYMDDKKKINNQKDSVSDPDRRK